MTFQKLYGGLLTALGILLKLLFKLPHFCIPAHRNQKCIMGVEGFDKREQLSPFSLFSVVT